MDTRRPVSAAGLAVIGLLLLMTLAAVALGTLRDGRYLESDAAQYLSAAVNLLGGDGISTDILFYDEQYRHGSIPAPLTVFPPGLPILLAGPLALGADPASASFAVGLATFCATGALVFFTLRRLGVIAPLALLAAATWLGLGLGWANVLMGRAEVSYTCATLACVLISVEARRRPGMLLAVGALAGTALLLRYQGLFFLAALAVWVAIPLVRNRFRDPIPAVVGAAAVLAVPVVVAGLLLFRNWSLTGAPGGGPIDTVNHGVGWLDLLRSWYWTIASLTGLSIEDLAAEGIAEVLVVTGACLIAAAVSSGVRSSRGGRTVDVLADRRVDFATLALVYMALSTAALCFLAVSRAGDYLQGRFLVPLVPFAIMLWVILVDGAIRAAQGMIRGLWLCGLCALHCGLLLAQSEVTREALTQIRADRRIAVIKQAMDENYDGATVGAYLRRVASREHPVLAESGQQLWLVLGRPVLVTTPAGFSNRVWDDAAVRILAACYGARHVVFFPPVFHADLRHNANRVLFRRLARGDVPPYLRLLHRGPAIELYSLEIETSGVACAGAGRLHP
jgi:hypothetical protein